MIALRIIKACFTRQFQHEYGDCWESTCADLLNEAKTQGGAAWVWAWFALVVDTAWRAPVMHMRAYRAAVVGPPLVLAGLGPVQGSIAVAKHWAWRPAAGLWMWAASYVVVFVVGMMMAVVTNAYLSYAAGGSDVDSSHALVFNNSILWLGVVLALGTTAFGVRRGWVVWCDRGCPILAPAFVLSVSWMLTMFSLFLNELPSVGQQAVSPFVAFPHHRNTPVSNPNGLDDTDITDGHRAWFRPTGTRIDGTEQIWELIPEQKDAWCATKLGVLGVWEAEIRSRPYQVGHEVTTLLWRSSLLDAGVEGCLDVAEVLRRDTAMALWANANVSALERKWRPMISFVPLVDNILSAKYIVGPSVLPKASNYCHIVAAGLVRGDTPTLYQREAFCARLGNEWTARHNTYQTTRPVPYPAFSPWNTHTDYFEDQLNHAAVFGPEDLAWVTQRVTDSWPALVEGGGMDQGG